MDPAIMAKQTDRRGIVARRIKRLRIKAGLSQEQLGIDTGYTRQGISLIEKTGAMSEQGRRVLAMRLGVDPSVLR